MMRFKYLLAVISYISSGLFVLLILSSCEEEISIELNDQEHQRIVVEGRITDEFKQHRVRITKTLSYFDNTVAPAMENNEVYIIEEGTGLRFELSLSTEDTTGVYLSEEFAGKVGETYSLMIKYNNETFKAIAYLNSVARMDSINYYYHYDYNKETGDYIVRMSAYEPDPIGHIYMFYFYLNDTIFNDELVETIYTNDIGYNDVYLPDVKLWGIPQEEITDTSYLVRVEMLSISEEEYEYNNAFLNEAYGNGSIFGGPPANIPSNVKNNSGGLDGVGFFSASAVSAKEIILRKEHDESKNDPDYERW